MSCFGFGDVCLSQRPSGFYRTFILHALGYWAEIVYTALKSRVTDKVNLVFRLICQNMYNLKFLFRLKILQVGSFPHFFSYMFWGIDLKFCILLCCHEFQIKFPSGFSAQFFLHAFLYAALLSRVTDQVRVLSDLVKYCIRNAPFWT